MTTVHVCNFSAGAGELSREDRKDRLKVLEAVHKVPRISTWDMAYGLWKPVYELIQDGVIVEKDEPYPYHRFELTEKGRSMLEGQGSGGK